MLDSLKDLYISHPFLPVADAPEWFSHIKDIRCVVTFDAANNILQYKKNGNYVRAWLVGLTAASATVEIECKQIQDAVKSVTLVTCLWTDYPVTVPDPDNNREATRPFRPQSYVLVDSDFVPPEHFSGRYELNPDTLVIMQTAPIMSVNGVPQEACIEAHKGHNVAVSKSNNGILFYGASDVGDRMYKSCPIAGVLGDWQQGLGARNINGMTGDLWLSGVFPVKDSFDQPVVEIDPDDRSQDITLPSGTFSLTVEAGT